MLLYNLSSIKVIDNVYVMSLTFAMIAKEKNIAKVNNITSTLSIILIEDNLLYI